MRAAGLALGGKLQLRPGEAVDEFLRVGEPQLGADVVTGAGVGGGRDGQAAEGITLYGASDIAFALRRINEREVGPEVKQAQVRKARQLYAMLDGLGCRAVAVRRYFGEDEAQPCGQCDVCVSPPESRDATRCP